MSDPFIFITGATGYIGGDVLFAINQKFPRLQSKITALIRSEDKAVTVAAAYPELRVVRGDLNDHDLLQDEAAKCDICIHCASLDDLGAAKAISCGLAARSSLSPAFLIAVSGTDNITWETIKARAFGEQFPQIYDDEENLQAVLDLPLEAPHRDVEQEQLGSASEQLKVAIVCPPCIYGEGRGPVNQRSIQLPDLAKYTLEHGASFKVNAGQSRWPNVHIHDLSNVFLSLFANALEGGGEAQWGPRGYYFASNGLHVWGEIAQIMAETAQRKGYIKSADVKTISASEADDTMPLGALLYGADSVCRALKARRRLGWKPTKHDLLHEIELTLEREATSLY